MSIPVKFTIKTRRQRREEEGREGSEEDLSSTAKSVQEEDPEVFEDTEESFSSSEEEVELQEGATGKDAVSTHSPSSVSTSTEDHNEEVQEGDDMAERLTIMPGGKFRGGIEDVEEYLTQFERLSRANGWTEDKKKVILPCYLEGAALKWYENLEGTVGADVTWAQIKDGLRETFQGIAQEEQLEFKLRMRMQGEVEPVEAYIQDVLNLCHKVDGNMVERTKIKHVLRGLKPSLLEKVMLMVNDTLANLMLNIRKIETARYMAGQRVDHLMSDPHQSTSMGGAAIATEGGSSVRSLESKIENLTTEFAKLGMKLMEQTTAAGPRDSRGDGRGRLHGDARGGRQEFQPRGRGDSYQRGRETFRGPYRGRASYQGQPRGRTADGRVICYKCNRPGHYAVACKSTSQGNEEGGR